MLPWTVGCFVSGVLCGLSDAHTLSRSSKELTCEMAVLVSKALFLFKSCSCGGLEDSLKGKLRAPKVAGNELDICSRVKGGKSLGKHSMTGV